MSWTLYEFTSMLPDRVKFLDSNLPERRLSNVVLPHPDGPTIAVKVLGENIPSQGWIIFLFIFLFYLMLFGS